MDRKVLSFIALAITMLYGVTVALSGARDVVAPVGAVLVALAWIAVGMFGKDERKDES